MRTYQITTKILKDLGVPVNLSGFHHLRYAICMTVKDISFLNSITKKLYPAVADSFNIKPMCAERCMRHAIETSWLRGNKETQNELFGYTIDMNKGKPTNTEFIATVADYIRTFKSEVGTHGI